MGPVVPAPCCGGAPRTPSVRRTVWVVVVVVAGLVVAAGQEIVHDYEYSPHLDDQHRYTTNASDGLSSPRQSFTGEYFKCRCEGNQVWDGYQCSDTQTNVLVMIPATQSVVAALTDDFAGVTVREVQCPPDYAQVQLEPSGSPSHQQFFLLSNGSLWWQQRQYENYCLEHTLDDQSKQTWKARVCLPPPPVPRCCPESTSPAADGVSCSNNLALPFSPPILTGDEFIKWPRLVDKTKRNCNEFEKTLKLSLNSGESNLSYESGEVSIAWKSSNHVKKKQKDGFCVIPQEGGVYAATICYEDHEAIHRSYCENATCIRKCCPEGEINVMPHCGRAENAQLWKPEFVDSNNMTRIVPTPKDLKILYGLPQCAMYLADPDTAKKDKFYLLENGLLFTPAHAEKESPTQYCIDNFLNFDNTVSTRALICFSEEQVEPVCAMAKKSLYPALLIVSSGFLGLTLVIYLSMPDLRKKLHGRCLISLAFAFFVAYILMAVSYLSVNLVDTSTCIALAFFKHFSLLAAFFWLNVMCFDIWRTLRKTRVIDGGVWALRRFLWYCLYSWGCPLVIALATVVIEKLPDSYDVIRPNFSNHACWFHDYNAMWLYFYMWVSVLVVANVVFFGLVITILVKGQNNSMLRRSRNMNRERMWLYGKLFLVMGLTWVAEVISYQNGQCVGWIFTDVINALQGLTLFLVFILSPSTIRKVKDKCCGKPARSALSPSSTQTSTFSSSSIQAKRLDSSFKSSFSSRMSTTSATIKDLNTESAIPLNTLSEAPDESCDLEPQNGNPQSIEREKEAVSLKNGDAERGATILKGDGAPEET